jgi:hypothetical protein
MNIYELIELAKELPPNSDRPEFLVERNGEAHRFVKMTKHLEFSNDLYWDYNPPDEYNPNEYYNWVRFLDGKLDSVNYNDDSYEFEADKLFVYKFIESNELYGCSLSKALNEDVG